MDELSLANEKHKRDSSVIDLQNKLIKNIDQTKNEQRDTICKLQKEVEKYKKKYKDLKEERILKNNKICTRLHRNCAFYNMQE